MMRKAALDGQLYREEFQLSQDYELFCRLSTKGGLANLNTPLVYYRIHDKNSSGNSEKLRAAENKIRRSQLTKLGIDATEEELKLHSKLPEGPFPKTIEELRKVEAWLIKIMKHNEESRVYQKSTLGELIKLFFMRSCERSGLGIKAVRFYYQSILSGKFWSKPIGNLIFIMKTLYRSYAGA